MHLLWGKMKQNYISKCPSLIKVYAGFFVVLLQMVIWTCLYTHLVCTGGIFATFWSYKLRMVNWSVEVLHL